MRWTNDHVHALFPGIAQMAMTAASQTDKPVYIVPLVWKYRFVRDVSARMHREMGILETGLALPRGHSATAVSRRFHALQVNLLAKQMARFGYADLGADGEFFARQSAFQRHTSVDALAQHYPTGGRASQSTGSIARLTRAIRADDPRAVATSHRRQRRSVR